MFICANAKQELLRVTRKILSCTDVISGMAKLHITARNVVLHSQTTKTAQEKRKRSFFLQGISTYCALFSQGFDCF